MHLEKEFKRLSLAENRLFKKYNKIKIKLKIIIPIKFSSV